MDFSDFQSDALRTDRIPERDGAPSKDVIVPLLGLAGETGELLSEYKKHLRDGSSHKLFVERVSEELGDLLWYIANVASKFNIDLNDVALKNLKKTQDRWGKQESLSFIFDSTFPDDQRFPRQFEVELCEVEVDGHIKIRALMNGVQIGNDLTDNSDDPDGYRFHDVFHLAYVAVLGWSPVIRKLLGRKRKDDPKVDEVQDGGRAQVIDEGISALVFDYAKNHNWLEGVIDLDYQLLRTIKGITSFLEVSERSMGEWQRAILLGFAVWRQVLANGGGKLFVDLDSKSLTYQSAPTLNPADDISAEFVMAANQGGSRD